MKYSIAPEIVERYPGYVRGVVVVRGAENSGPENPEIVALLRQAEESVQRRADLDSVAQHPRIAAWREAYRKFGAKPSDFHSLSAGCPPACWGEESGLAGRRVSGC